MFEHDLIRKINSGRCFALIGAGPSMAAGYASWESLAKAVRDHVLSTNPEADIDTYRDFLGKSDYPAVLRQAEIDLGSREALLTAVSAALGPHEGQTSTAIYEHLAKWPFACYLTTNFDDEIEAALRRIGQHFAVVHNSREDLSLLRDGVTNLIVKIHSDLSRPDQAVVTSVDYDRILSSPKGAHIRDKLRQVFEMFDVVIIGHSMSDPDLKLVLSMAKHGATPLHPIYMIASNVTLGQAREFREQFNIRVIPYKDFDHSHRQLRRLLSVVDHFISHRGHQRHTAPEVDEAELQAATALFIFRRLRTILAKEPMDDTIRPLVMATLSSSERALTPAQILQSPSLAPLVKAEGFSDGVTACLAHMKEQGLAEQRGDEFVLSTRGRAAVDDVVSQRRLEEEQAFGQFEIDLRQALPGLTEQQCAESIAAVRRTIVSSFRDRGLAMANVIVAEQSVGVDELHDIFHELSRAASEFEDFDLTAAFIETAYKFVVEPSEPQKKYLASISQGFFLYHMAGLDPTCARVRQDLFASTCWFLDSSVLLPLLAIGCHNYPYAKDLFDKLLSSDAVLFSTENLLKETWRHLEWAMAFAKRCPVDSAQFMATATSQEGYRQNLFIDGYIRMSAEGKIGTFGDYLRLAFPNGASPALLLERCDDLGIQALRAADMEGFSQDHWGDIEFIKQQLTDARKRRNTYRGELQVESEAEVLVIIRGLRRGNYSLPALSAPPTRVYFVSQSRALDMVADREEVVTWTPEAVYRYICSLSGAALDPELLQKCMLHTYFYAGVSFIDKSLYLRFFGPSVSQAKLAYKDQVDEYLDQTEQAHRRAEYDEAFNRTPDLEKPFFVAQMGWKLARRSSDKADAADHKAQAVTARAGERVRVAEARAKTAEADAEVARKARRRAEQAANRLRNLRDPKHLRKRKRQSKKRARKKRK